MVIEQNVATAMEVLRDVVGAKSPKTINKRTNSMLFLIGRSNVSLQLCWPFDHEYVLEWSEVRKGKPVASRGRTLMEAFRFCRHVLQIQELDRLATDPQLTGHSKRLDCGKAEADVKQTRPLKPSEVQSMEKFRVSKNQSLEDLHCTRNIIKEVGWGEMTYKYGL